MTAIARARPVNSAVFALMGVVTVFALTQGVTYPLLSVELERMGFGTGMIGLSGAMTPLGMVLSGPVMPKLIQRTKTLPTLVVAILLTIVMFFALGAFENFYAWLLFRFLLGIAVSALYLIGEAGLQNLVTDEARGRVMGIYNAMMVLGYGAGPALLSVVGTQGWLPLIASIAIIASAIVPVLAVAGEIPEISSDDDDVTLAATFRFAQTAPALLLACGAVAFFDHASTSLLPIFGKGHGLTEDAAVQLATASMLGAMAGQFFVGWLADRLGIPSVMVGCGTIVVGGCMLLPVAIQTPAVWPLCVIWGAAAFGPFTLALTDLGRRFSGNTLMIGNAAISVTYGLSQSLGSPAAGAAMDLAGPNGFTITIGMTFALLVLIFAPKVTRDPAPREDVTEVGVA